MLILSKKHTTPMERFRQTTHAESTEIRRVFSDKTLFNAECGVRS